jgi:hypothetical protein
MCATKRTVDCALIFVISLGFRKQESAYRSVGVGICGVAKTTLPCSVRQLQFSCR